jgi:CrcB protein
MNGLPLVLGIGALGGIGSMARFALHRGVTAADPRDFPFGTFIANVAGAFLIGLLSGASDPGDLRTLLGLGFLGGFTTFSTWMYESTRLASDGAPRAATMNVAISVGAGLVAVTLGVALG